MIGKLGMAKNRFIMTRISLIIKLLIFVSCAECFSQANINKVDIEYIPTAKDIGPMVGYTTHTKSSIWYYAGQGRAVELRYGKKGVAITKLIKQNMPPRPENNFTSLAEIANLVP